ncbi:MAG: DUF1318 domain-containing protein [Verrucomicrobiia bacterium]
MPLFFLLIPSIFFLIGCTPNVRLSTPEPVKIDVNMKVEVVQKPSTASETNLPPVATTRRNRMAQIQNLKDNRIVGENQNGYLTVLNVPPTWQDQEDYIQSLVKAENTDRQFINTMESRRTSQLLATVEKESAQRFQASSFPGEWIQNGEGKWIQKESNSINKH